MSTSFPMANPWVDGEGLNAAKMQARVTTPLNDLFAAALADTGWVDIVLLTGFTCPVTAAGGKAQARQIGSVVTLRGHITRTAGNYPTTNTSCATLPADVTPPPTSARVATAGFASASANGLLLQMVAGSTNLQGASIGIGADTLYLDNVQWIAT